MSVSVLTQPKAKRGTRASAGKKTARAGKSADGMAGLKAAARAGDEAAFLAACATIEWRARSARDYVRAVRWALEAGAPVAARQLASGGAERYPDYIELVNFARVLNPPPVTRGTAAPDPTIKADMEWFTRHSAEYRGQWVAVQNGRLLGAAPTIQALMERVPSWRETTLTQIMW